MNGAIFFSHCAQLITKGLLLFLVLFGTAYTALALNNSPTPEGSQMESKIVKFNGKRLVGLNMTMSLVQDRTSELWRSFQARKAEVQNASGPELFSLQVFPADYFSQFSPANTFTKW